MSVDGHAKRLWITRPPFLTCISGLEGINATLSITAHYLSNHLTVMNHEQDFASLENNTAMVVDPADDTSHLQPNPSGKSSLASRLPHDVLHHLFATCHQVVDQPSDLPVILSHVCSSWRFTALVSPMLWTVIMMSCVPDSHHHMVEAHLSRSKGLPIDFYIRLTQDFRPDEVEMILSNASRIRKLDILEIGNFLIPRIFTVLNANLANIEDLDIKVESETFESRVRVTWSPDSSPQDNRCRLPIVKPGDDIWSDVQVSGITGLRLDYLPDRLCPSLDELHHILALNQSTLECLEIRGLAPEVFPDDEGLHLPQLELPALHTLVICYHLPQQFVPMFFFFSFPNLVELALRDLRRHAEEDTPLALFGDEENIAPSQSDASLLIASIPPTLVESLVRLALYGVECKNRPAARFVRSFKNMREVIFYDTTPNFFESVFDAKLPSTPVSPRILRKYPCTLISKIFVTTTTTTQIMEYFARRSKAGLPRMEEFTFSTNCAIPSTYINMPSMGWPLLEALRNGSELAIVVDSPPVVNYYMPVEGYDLVSNGEVHISSWRWFLSQSLRLQ